MYNKFHNLNSNTITCVIWLLFLLNFEFDGHPRSFYSGIRNYLSSDVNGEPASLSTGATLIRAINSRRYHFLILLFSKYQPRVAVAITCFRTEIQKFPVKLTDPVTAILYITPDKKHIELLKHALHVKEIKEAPAHEHRVIALHKHGHHFGGLPTLFWSLICFLIIVFHLFLCKLIYNEYCDKQDKYNRPSDRGRGRYNRL